MLRSGSGTSCQKGGMERSPLPPGGSTRTTSAPRPARSLPANAPFSSARSRTRMPPRAVNTPPPTPGGSNTPPPTPGGSNTPPPTPGGSNTPPPPRGGLSALSPCHARPVVAGHRALRHARRGVALDDAAASGRPEARPQRRIARESRERSPERRRIRRRHEVSRLAIHDGLREPPHPAGHDGPSRRHRFERRDAEPLLQRRQRDDVG